MRYIDNKSHLGYGMYKNVSELKLTREIQYFAKRCEEENSLLIIKVPDICKISKSLENLIETLVDKTGQKRIRIIRIRT